MEGGELKKKGAGLGREMEGGMSSGGCCQISDGGGKFALAKHSLLQEPWPRLLTPMGKRVAVRAGAAWDIPASSGT